MDDETKGRYCGLGSCSALAGHDGSCAEASGWETGETVTDDETRATSLAADALIQFGQTGQYVSTREADALLFGARYAATALLEQLRTAEAERDRYEDARAYLDRVVRAREYQPEDAEYVRSILEGNA